MVDFKCDECNRVFTSKEALDMHNNSKHYSPPKISINKKKVRGWGIFAIIILVIVGAAYGMVYLNNQPGKYDEFAQCLTDSGVKMFGAYWCPHCQDQKNIFGKSFDNINYVECSLPNQGGQNEICNDEGIESYPTWEFEDGERVGGVISLERFEAMTDCTLNN
jgi:glutaredoxin